MIMFLTYLSLTSISMAIGVLVMMKGWGLQPHSWWWIIGVGVFVNAIWRVVVDRVEKEMKEK